MCTYKDAHSELGSSQRGIILFQETGIILKPLQAWNVISGSKAAHLSGNQVYAVMLTFTFFLIDISGRM